MHNDVVKSDIHSTDTHGYSEIIFGALHLLGFSFAPRIKHLKDQQLYGFRKRREYAQLPSFAGADEGTKGMGRDHPSPTRGRR